MTTADFIERIRDHLNRPEADDFFSTREYYNALTTAQGYIRRRVAEHRVDLIRQVDTLLSEDGGASYLLTDDHLGQLEVWSPPGPPDGQLILPSQPESGRGGYYMQGRSIRLNSPTIYNPMYIRWVPATPPPVDAGNDPDLPSMMEDLLVYRSAYQLSLKQGFLGNPADLLAQARMEWSGDPSDDSDTGVLGTITNQEAYGGVEAVNIQPRTWYERIR